MKCSEQLLFIYQCIPLIILHSFLFPLLMHEEGCMEPLLRLSTCHSTSSGNPLAPHSNDTFCPLSLENSISTLGLTNQGVTRQLTKEHQYVRWYFSNKPSRLHNYKTITIHLYIYMYIYKKTL